MQPLRFDEQKLVQELERLSTPCRTAFAAAAAERLFPAYASFARQSGRGDSSKLAGVLERLWQDIEGSRTNARQQQDDIDLCMALIPQEGSGPWIPEQAYAEDAAAALTYALRSRKSGQASEAAWAARRAYEALDHFVVAQEKIDTNQPGAEKRILSNSLIQAELSRQRRDISDLAGDQSLVRIVDRIRERAKAESDFVFKSKPH